jgi:hypothetical protein
VVFIGSEGERAVLARNLGDLLWLLAAGFGPGEAYRDPDAQPQPAEDFRAIAHRHAPAAEQPAAQIVAAARAEFPHFSELIDSLCR